MLLLRLRFALRSIARYDIFSKLNILGLIISIFSITVIYFFVKSELQTDSQFTDTENIYRIVRSVEEKNASYQTPLLSGVFKERIQSKSGLADNQIARVYQDDELMSYESQTFFEPNVLYVDEYFLDVLDFPLKKGDAITSLKKPNAAIISERIAEKYFSDEDPIGKVLEMDGKGKIQITGVLANMEGKSHLEIDFLINKKAMGYSAKFLQDEEAHAFAYYFNISEEKYRFLSEDLIALNNEFLNQKGYSMSSLELQPLKEVYFAKNLSYDFARHNDMAVIQTFSAIALVLLIITIANLVNLNIARVSKKIQQIGVKRILGSSKSSLAFEWAIEVYLLLFFATLISVFLYDFALPFISDAFSIYLPQADLTSIFLSLLIFPLLLSALVIIIPSMIFISINPYEALLGKMEGLRSNAIQHSLLGLQFGIAFVLISLTIVIVKQFEFMQQKDIGMNTEEVLIFDSNNKHSWKNKEYIANEINSLVGVNAVSMTYGGIPGSPTEAIAYESKGESYQWNTAYVKENLIQVLGLTTIDGIAFDDSRLKGVLENSVVLNKTAAQALGWPEEEVVGRSIDIKEDGISKRIVGIIEDYHYESFKEKIEPLVMQITGWEESFVVKLHAQSYQNTISDIEEIWTSYVPRYPFSYRFLDESFQKIHAEDTKNKKIIFALTILSILISSISTLSLVALVQESRIKEVSIRKVLGAPIKSIFLLLGFGFLRNLIISVIVSIPLAWWIARYWLNDFNYAIDISPLFFATGFIMLLLVISIIVILQSWKTATLNPIERLQKD